MSTPANSGKKWTTLIASTYAVSAQGQTSVSYRSVDRAGNLEAAKSILIKIDSAAPSISISVPKSGAYRVGTKLTAKWSASDLTSGVANTTGTLASGQAIDTSAPGTFSFSVVASDNAGNTTTKTVIYSVR